MSYVNMGDYKPFVYPVMAGLSTGCLAGRCYRVSKCLSNPFFDLMIMYACYVGYRRLQPSQVDLSFCIPFLVVTTVVSIIEQLKRNRICEQIKELGFEWCDYCDDDEKYPSSEGTCVREPGDVTNLVTVYLRLNGTIYSKDYITDRLVADIDLYAPHEFVCLGFKWDDSKKTPC